MISNSFPEHKETRKFFSMDVQPIVGILKTLYVSIKMQPFSILFFQTEAANWVLNWEQKEVREIAAELGLKTGEFQRVGIQNQCIMYISKYFLTTPRRYIYLAGNSRIAFPYFHGYPDTGDQQAVECYNGLKKCHKHISRIQVSHAKMHNFVLDTGIDSSKVFRIPIAVNSNFFSVQSRESRKSARLKYNIPETAVVVGSFQKDGSGWGEGMDPKLIKGPDTFLKAIKILKSNIPEVFVLLSGPSRGYIKAGLETIQVPYRHIFLDHYPDIGRLYQCLDLYIVSSREEGGPKAVLESMISGIPLVSTAVGQAVDLVDHCENACLTQVEDHEALAHWAEKIVSDIRFKERLVVNGLKTACANTYAAHIPLWKKFFEGFVRTA